MVSSHFMTVQIRRKSHLVIEVWLNNKVTVIIQVFLHWNDMAASRTFSSISNHEKQYVRSTVVLCRFFPKMNSLKNNPAHLFCAAV